MNCRKILKKFLWGERADSGSYIKYLRRKGVKIGERVVFFAPNMTHVDMTRPWLIEIGDDVQITAGVTILTHGYDWSVLKKVYGDVLGSSGRVKIGNNVFLGINTTILKGVTIGDNVIIGANSLVNKNIPSNCVAAGNPAKVVMSLDEYYIKRKKKQVEEAKELGVLYKKCYGEEPDERVLSEFFWLFSDANSELPECWREKMILVGNEEQSYETLKNNKKTFVDMKEFLRSL